MVGRHYDDRVCCPYTCGYIARIELPWTSFGVTDVAFIEILGEREEERIGQNDCFVMVEFAHVRIGQMDYFFWDHLPLASERRISENRVQECVLGVAEVG